MRFQVASNTNVGKRRTQNQDYYVAYPELGLFLITDGMGGHRGGEIASQEAATIIYNDIKKNLDQSLDKNKVHYDPLSLLQQAIKKANQEIYEHSQKDKKLEGMGTTTTVLFFKKNILTIGHVGDSRCYYCRPNGIWQLTRDHSLVQERFNAGLMTREEMKSDQSKNIITRSVGFESNVPVDLYQFQIKASDCFLICSDGLSGLVNEIEILKIIHKHFFQDGQIEKMNEKLIEKANELGGNDNVTSIFLQIMSII